MAHEAVEQEIDYLGALRIEANRQLDEAVESGEAHAYGSGAWFDDHEGGLSISRGDGFLSVKVGYDEFKAATGKLLDLTVEVEFHGEGDSQLVSVYEERSNPDTDDFGRRDVPRRKHQETAALALKTLLVVV